MVKPVIPPPVDNSLDWLMHEGGGALFSGLVPYGVHLALSESFSLGILLLQASERDYL